MNPVLRSARACLLAALLSHGLSLTGADTATPAAQRHKLTHGALFVPAGFRPAADGVEVTLHLHGAADVVEREFLAARRAGVLLNVTLPGLSKVYADHFRDPAVFSSLIEETGRKLQPLASLPAPPPIRSVTVTSFSAGFGGVRELLKHEPVFQRVDALVMADSIYAGFAGDAAGRKVSPENMEGFLRFARAAAEGRKHFLLTHSQLHTPTYASTVETADYLLAQLGGQREAAGEEWEGGLKLLSRFQRGNFEVLSFAGDTGEHHMQHLRRLGLFLQRLPR